jgi:hypothetical protein
VCVCACVRACVCACVCVRVRVCACVEGGEHLWWLVYKRYALIKERSGWLAALLC